MVENTWNVSMRLMLDIPRETHRYLIEPLSRTTHIKTIFINRFLRFLEQIRKSSKCASKHLLDSILHDARSTTGSNLRNILLKSDKARIVDLIPEDAYQVKYHQITTNEKWRLPFIQNIIETKNDQMMIMNITNDELDDMLDVLCTS